MNPFLFEEFLRRETEATARRLELARRAREARGDRNGSRLGGLVSAFARFVPRRLAIARPASLVPARLAGDRLETLTPAALGAAGRTRFDDEIASDCCA